MGSYQFLSQLPFFGLILKAEIPLDKYVNNIIPLQLLFKDGTRTKEMYNIK